jgi:hypothetical protein
MAHQINIAVIQNSNYISEYYLYHSLLLGKARGAPGIALSVREIIIQDADLELIQMISCAYFTILKHEANIVYGSRFLNSK